MAPLPAVRFEPSRPFSAAGLDYAGPIPVLFSKGRGAKTTEGYVAIFVCLVVRAIHVEIVSDLTTKAFLAAYARFVARRGLCAVLYSDNATTFKCAAIELSHMFSNSSAFVRETSEALASQGTEWRFIPPCAPHFGGIWEAAVRSFKHHFVRVIGAATFTFEELSTLAAKIEACLNSRPLCPISTQADELAPLSPGHFLVGSCLLTIPEPYDESMTDCKLRNRWRSLTLMRDAFWTRWRKEVLHQMQQRNKWIRPQRNLEVGDIVIITDELSPPTKWPLGRVIETHTGKDNLVRVVTLKTATSRVKRAVNKLVWLPTDLEAIDSYDQRSSSESTNTE